MISDEAILYWVWGDDFNSKCQVAGIGPVLHIRCVNLSGVMVQIEKGAYSVGHSSVKGKVQRGKEAYSL